MIYSVSGTLELIEPNHIVVSCGGVGFSVRTSMTTISELPPVGNEVKVYTYLSVREDALELFGFHTQKELSVFKLLISVSGVGPKGAVSILSSLNPDRLSLCIANGDVKLLKAPGIGPKTAERIILELKDKVSGSTAVSEMSGKNSGVSLSAGNASEAISALETLGYNHSEAAKAIMKLDGDTPVEDMIKYGLKELAGGIH